MLFLSEFEIILSNENIPLFLVVLKSHSFRSCEEEFTVIRIQVIGTANIKIKFCWHLRYYFKMTNIYWSVIEKYSLPDDYEHLFKTNRAALHWHICLKLVYSVLDEKHIFGEITKKQCLAIGNLSTWLCILSLKKVQKTMERLNS